MTRALPVQDFSLWTDRLTGRDKRWDVILIPWDRPGRASATNRFVCDGLLAKVQTGQAIRLQANSSQMVCAEVRSNCSIELLVEAPGKFALRSSLDV